MKRSHIREKIFQFLYQIQIQKENYEEQKNLFFEGLATDISSLDLDYFKDLLDNYKNQEKEIDESISSYLRGWSLERISKVDLALLRLAFLEIKNKEETPKSVIAAEIIELASQYTDERSKKYINGILGKFTKEISSNDGLQAENQEENQAEN